MKMWFRERHGEQQVWRSCIRGAQGKIRSDCTKITSGDGDMEVCTCAGHLCNGAATAMLNTIAMIITAAIFFFL